MATTANSLSEVLKNLQGAALDQSKAQLEEWITQAKADGSDFIKASATQLEQWLIDLHNKDMTALEFNGLIAAQEIVARNFVLRQTLAAQKRAEDLTVNLLQLAATKIVPALLVAI